MSVETAAAIVAISLVAIAVAVVIAAAAAVRFLADARRILDELPPRIERLDGLADEAEATMAEVRESLRATGEVVRAPLTAVANVSRVIREFGEELGEQADRVRGKPRWKRSTTKAERKAEREAERKAHRDADSAEDAP